MNSSFTPSKIQEIEASSAIEENMVRIARTSSKNEQAPLVFTDIYDEQVNIVTWQRDLSESLKKEVEQFLIKNSNLELSINVTNKNVSSALHDVLGASKPLKLIDDISTLVNVFCDLFEASQAGLRLAVLDRAMCPKFHVDKVPCRLITTYQGVATEWLPHEKVDRSKLGMASKGLKDSESGIYQSADDIEHLSCGDVAILKGETWHNNEGAGLVHRSPSVAGGEKRFVLTLDYIA